MITRREMLKSAAVLSSAALLTPQTLFANAPESRKFAEKLGWTIGPQIYSYKRFTFEDALKKVKENGATSFEQFTGMRVSQKIGVRVGPDLLKKGNEDALKTVKDILDENGLKIHAVGVCGSGKADFDFAAEFKIPVLNTEPGSAANVEAAGRLAEEYNIKVGLHNHPKNSHYWDPQTVIREIANAGPLVGACCDTGHWLRSGLSPLECIKKLKGHIVSFHIKDLKKHNGGYDGADVPLGRGEVGIADILKEVAAQGAKNIPFSIEFETKWDNNVGDVTEGIKFFDAACKEIIG